MPTNDERREVAARLRNYENLRESFRESPIGAFLDAMGVGYLDWKGVCNRLADLIEPEHERTCRNVYESKVDQMLQCNNGFMCSECGEKVEDEEHCHVKGTWNFCPKCGARIIKDAN